MNYLKQVSWVKVSKGYQTYLFTTEFLAIRYKLFSNEQELNQALEKAKAQGWKTIDATNATNRLRQQSSKK